MSCLNWQATVAQVEERNFSRRKNVPQIAMHRILPCMGLCSRRLIRVPCPPVKAPTKGTLAHWTGPWSNGRRLPDLMNLLFLYNMNIYLGRRWQQDALWQGDKFFEGVWYPQKCFMKLCRLHMEDQLHTRQVVIVFWLISVCFFKTIMLYICLFDFMGLVNFLSLEP